MGLIKNEHGVFHVRRKVPKILEVATARVLGGPKERVSWLKETLATKDEKRAKVLAKPVMMKFDSILANPCANVAASCEENVRDPPARPSLYSRLYEP